ncbi:MAG: dihydroxyacetone kinase subunit L [Verrucomicrobia bacterium]|nr:dihydroxyacetone kinase subunit L [Verrucomicrobiota bacterium]
MLTASQILRWIEQYAKLISEQKDYLTQLDADIGDADHGANLDRGFQAVLTKKDELAGKDIGTIFKTVAMTLISKVGGASGPLYGTFFLQASVAAAHKDKLSEADFYEILEKGLAGITSRGKAKVGDKTMVDAFQPAVAAFKRNLDEGADFEKSLSDAIDAAERGMLSTIPLIARKGRASYLGERSAGHQDPGATSSVLLLKAARTAFS